MLIKQSNVVKWTKKIPKSAIKNKLFSFFYHVAEHVWSVPIFVRSSFYIYRRSNFFNVATYLNANLFDVSTDLNSNVFDGPTDVDSNVFDVSTDYDSDRVNCAGGTDDGRPRNHIFDVFRFDVDANFFDGATDDDVVNDDSDDEQFKQEKALEEKEEGWTSKQTKTSLLSKLK